MVIAYNIKCFVGYLNDNLLLETGIYQELKIIYEDDDLLVVNKPAGIFIGSW